MITHKKITSEYDKKKEEFLKFYDPNKNYTFLFTKNKNNKHNIEVYDKDKFVLKAEYSVMGNYVIYNSVWYWAYNIFMSDKDTITDSLKMKDYAKKLKTNHKKYDSVFADEAYYICNNNNFYTKFSNLEKVIKLAIHVVDSVFYLAVKYDENNDIITDDANTNVKRIEYLFIKEILQIGEKV